MERSQLRHRLLNDYQRDFPLEPRPYARIAEDLGLQEDEVLALLGELMAEGKIGRVGAIVRPNSIGASTLAAVAAPAARLEEVATTISAGPEVNHCYERDHPFSLWFVVTAGDRREVRHVLDEIERATGLAVIDVPIVEAYHIDLGFDLRCG